MHSKGNYKQGEKTTLTWEKIIANETADKGLISKIHKQLTQLNVRKKTTESKSGKKDLNRHFSKEDLQMANKHMKRCLILLIIREMQIKTAMRCYLTPVGMAVIKSLQTINSGESMEKREPSCTVCTNVN